jgi:hypothetical protein
MKKIDMEYRLMDCYRELYARATPSANFDYLMANAPTDEYGRKLIDYMNYELNYTDFMKVLSKHTKSLPKIYRKRFENTILLGCSPKFKRDESME